MTPKCHMYSSLLETIAIELKGKFLKLISSLKSMVLLSFDDMENSTGLKG